MALFEAAYQNGPYYYYHFLSGTDLPIKTKEEIYCFFELAERNNYLVCKPGAQFISRFKYYHNVFRSKIISIHFQETLNSILLKCQIKLKIDRTRWLFNRYPLIAKGHNWCDLTHEAVKELIHNINSIRRFCRFAHCPDELYKQIVLLNSKNENARKIASEDIRYIIWREGEIHPKVFRENDFESIMSSPALFARKFDDNIDMKIIDLIYDKLISIDVSE